MDDTFDIVDLDTENAVTPDSEDETTCSICGDNLPTNRGMKIHKSRVHGVKSPPPPKKSADSARATPGGKKQGPKLISDAKKFTRTSRELTTDLAAAGVAWLAIRWILSQEISVPKSDRDMFLIPETERAAMFKPILDGLESVTPVVRIINTIAERFDYIQCFLLWKAYIATINEYAQSRKEGLDNGFAGQSVATNSQQSDGNDESGLAFVRPLGYSGADFA